MTKQKIFGLIFRSYQPKEDEISTKYTLEKTQTLIDRALAIKKSDGKPFFRKIHGLIWADERFIDEHDYGKIAGPLRRQNLNNKMVKIKEVKHGDLYCGILNYGIGLQVRDKIDISVIVSPEASSYLKQEALEEFQEAFMAGAKVAGLAIKELRSSILEGRLVNTFSAWDNLSLITAGLFDSRAAKIPKYDKHGILMQGWSEEEGEVYYHLAGVEEIIPLAKLINMFGPCLAPIKPKGKGHYAIPDKNVDPEGYKRHLQKLDTKLRRQLIMLSSIGYDSSYLKGGVMPLYRQWEKDAP